MNHIKSLVIAIYVCSGSFLLNEFIKFYISNDDTVITNYLMLLILPLLIVTISLLIYLKNSKE